MALLCSFKREKMYPQMSSLCPQPDFPSSEMFVLWLNVAGPVFIPLLHWSQNSKSGRKAAQSLPSAWLLEDHEPKNRDQSMLPLASESHRPYLITSAGPLLFLDHRQKQEQGRGWNRRSTHPIFTLLSSVPSPEQLCVYPPHKALPENLPAPAQALLTSPTLPRVPWFYQALPAR